MMRKIAAFLLSVGVIVLIVGCVGQGLQVPGNEAPPAQAPAAQTRQSVVDDVQERGVLRVGVDCQYKGTCYIDPDSGERKGYSVVLTELMAEDLDVDLQWVDLEWTALIPAIQTGKVDIITQGMTNTPKRALTVEMSEPMDWYPGVLVLPADSPLHDLQTLDEVIAELNQPDRTIAFLLGGAQERTTKRMLPNAQHQGLDLAAAYLEVASGRADAMFADAGDAFDMTQQNPGGKVWRNKIVYTEHGSMAIRAGDQRFLNWVNNWLDYYEANGTLRSVKLNSYIERGVPQWMRALPPAEQFTTE